MLGTNTQAVHVPYKGSVEIVPSILSGATQFAFPIASTALGPVQQGTVRALATSGGNRLPQLPQVPTLKEAFSKDELALDSWGGIWAPAGTPAEVVNALNGALRKAIATTDTRDTLTKFGLIPSSNTPAEFARFIDNEIAHWDKVIQASGAKVD